MRKQKKLEDDVEEINKHIVEISRAERVEAIKLHEHIRRSSLKKIQGQRVRVIKLNYSKLVDGVHQDRQLKDRNFKYIVDVAKNRLDELYYREKLSVTVEGTSNPSNQDTETEEEEDKNQERKSWRNKARNQAENRD